MHTPAGLNLEPESTGFINRGAESITIMGGMLSEILNGLGQALSGISSHGSHLSGNPVSFAQANPGNLPGVSAKKLARARAVDATVPSTRNLGFTGVNDAVRVQRFIDGSN